MRDLIRFFTLQLIFILIPVFGEAAFANNNAKGTVSPALKGAPMHRVVPHGEAYKRRDDLGPHVNFKITPPEDRGKAGRVLVEVYNYSTTFLSVVNFWLILKNPWGDLIEVHVTCNDIKPNWSALRWVKIEGNKAFPKITQVEIKNMVAFNEKAARVQLRYSTALIKK
jgi:hypothetical protein